MALRAWGIAMLPGQRKWRLRVIEVRLIHLGLIPARRRMTTCTILTESSLVLVFMAGGAVRRQPHPRMVSILVGQKSAKFSGDVLCAVARPATDTHVFSIERITGLCVIES